jgi:fanconi anemia group J protein
LTSAISWQAQKYKEELALYEVAKAQEAEETQGDANAKPVVTLKRPKKATIYFCSRTHSQLQQVIDELKTLSSIDSGDDCAEEVVKFALLASRHHLCINSEVRARAEQDPSKGLDEVCSTMVKHQSCFYCHRIESVFDALTRQHKVWDIEDAVLAGRKGRGCSYFAANAAALQANFIVAPYNFIIDSNIRSAKKLDLRGAVCIFDEAHNIEGVARDAVSVDIQRFLLRAAVKNLDELKEAGTCAFESLASLLTGFLQWVDDMCETMEGECGSWRRGEMTDGSNNDVHEMWPGSEALEIWKSRFGLTAETLSVYEEHLRTVLGEQEDVEAIIQSASEGAGKKNSGEKVEVGYETDTHGDDGDAGPDDTSGKLSAGSLLLIRRLLTTMRYMYLSPQCSVDFKVVIQKESRPSNRSIKRHHGASDNCDYVFNIYCLNAACVFKELDEICHSLILTSGTLRPLDSFAGQIITECLPVTTH